MEGAMFETESTEPQQAPSPNPETQTEEERQQLREAIEKSTDLLPIPQLGEKLHATLTVIGEEHCFVDYGGRSEASIETKHLKGADGELTAAVGEKIEAYVISNEDGVVLAPTFTPSADEGLQALRDAHKASLPVSGKITGVNPGGVDVEIAGKRTFCPVSQMDVVHVPDPSAFIGQTHDFLITEFGEGGRRIVVSRRVLLKQKQEEAAARVRESLRVGEVRDGKVVRIESYGAFVDLGGLDGMVHVSEVSHDRVPHPSSVLKIGDAVRVQVLEVGKDPKGRNRISLSIKGAQQDPWLDVAHLLPEGQTVEGKIMRVTEFGAFVRLLPGVEGLVHVSEISDEPVSDPRRVLKESDEAKVRILGVDTQRRRISLTMRLDAPTSGKPRVGETVSGVVRTHKPYGIFIDLPSYGSRTSGLLPIEETGESKGSNLSKKFPSGEKIKVMIQQIDERGRIRLAIPGSEAAQVRENLGSRGVPSAMADALRRALGPDSKS